MLALRSASIFDRLTVDRGPLHAIRSGLTYEV